MLGLILPLGRWPRNVNKEVKMHFKWFQFIYVHNFVCMYVCMCVHGSLCMIMCLSIFILHVCVCVYMCVRSNVSQLFRFLPASTHFSYFPLFMCLNLFYNFCFCFVLSFRCHCFNSAYLASIIFNAFVVINFILFSSFFQWKGDDVNACDTTISFKALSSLIIA